MLNIRNTLKKSTSIPNYKTFYNKFKHKFSLSRNNWFLQGDSFSKKHKNDYIVSKELFTKKHIQTPSPQKEFLPIITPEHHEFNQCNNSLGIPRNNSTKNKLLSQSNKNTIVFKFDLHQSNNDFANEDKIQRKKHLYKLVNKKVNNVFNSYKKNLQYIYNNNKNSFENEDTKINLSVMNNASTISPYVKQNGNNHLTSNSFNIHKLNTHFKSFHLNLFSSKLNAIIKRYYYKTQAGKKEGGITKINQDAILIETNINNIKSFNIFGMLDGHGMNGHLVSNFVSDYIVSSLKSYCVQYKIKNLKDAYDKLKENDYSLIKNIYTNTESALIASNINCSYSGTTCVIVFHLGNRLICANTGDSRALAVFKRENKSLNCEYKLLSNDHKPNVPQEQQRIHNKGGVVFQQQLGHIHYGPYRVWVKNENFPGLAVSRSIGDIVASNIGVTALPEVIEMEIDENLNYIIIGSDGLFEFIDNNTIVKLSQRYYEQNDIRGLCNVLVKEATKRWKSVEKVIDDISIIALFF